MKNQMSLKKVLIWMERSINRWFKVLGLYSIENVNY